jgi:predicted transposase/invertase (TIGR01784 family)
MTATSVFSGLVLKPELIKTILRSEIMKESAVYQEILQEGEQRGLLKGEQRGLLKGEQRGLLKGEQIGLLKGKLETIPLLTKLGLTSAEIAEELDIDIALVNEFVPNQNY